MRNRTRGGRAVASMLSSLLAFAFACALILGAAFGHTASASSSTAAAAPSSTSAASRPDSAD